MHNTKKANNELQNIWKQMKRKNTQEQEEASNALYEYLQKHSDETDDIFEEFRLQLDSPNKEEKYGIFIALNQILGISRETQIVHYVNKLIPVMLQQLGTNNIDLEKGAECLGNLAEAGGSITAEVIDKSLNMAIEWLSIDKRSSQTDIKKYSAVLILREFCRKLPVITFNKLFGSDQHYLKVFDTFKDPREKVRVTAAEVINECIKQISERQQKRGAINQTSLIYNEIRKAFEENDPNFQHSALSVLGDLISSKGTKNEIITQQDQGSSVIKNVKRLLETSKNSLVRKKCIELIPVMYKNVDRKFLEGEPLKAAMHAIFDFIKQPQNKDRGMGYISLGKMSTLVEPKHFLPYLDEVLYMIENEVKPPIRSREGTLKPNVELDSLTCIRNLLKNFGKEIASKVDMYQLINDIFYSGYNKQVIDCLSEISRICRGQYKRAAQVKLLNSCSIILTKRIDNFPQHLEVQLMPAGPSSSEQDTSRSTGTFKSHEETVNLESGSLLGSVAHFGSGSTQNQDSEILFANFSLRDAQIIQDVNVQSKATPPEQFDEFNPKKVLKDFYKQALNKSNQKFLYELVRQSSVSNSDNGTTSVGNVNERTQMVTLALRTLAIFDFESFATCIVYFIENSVLNYLDDENPQVRKEAMKTCCSLQLPQTAQLRITSNMERVINKLLHRFFVTATTDIDDKIRETTLKYLNPQFDSFISRYENLLMLFNCMQDQNLEIRELTVGILGRLVPHNASQILPYLRQLVVSLISQLEQSNDAKEKEEAVKLLKTFVKSAPDLAKSYSTSILSCLIHKLDGERATSSFVSNILVVISEISKINNEAIKPYLGHLFPLILECIKDFSSLFKRQMAIKTLISIIENTGFVAKPYFYFPELLTTIMNLVQTEQNAEIRKLIFSLIGTLGAVDPYLMKQIKRLDEQRVETDDDLSEVILAMPTVFDFDKNDEGMRSLRKTSANSRKVDFLKDKPQPKNAKTTLVAVDSLNLSKENKYPAMAIHQLLKVLVDPNLRDHHKVCLDGIRYIVRNQPDCMPFMSMLIPPLMDLLKQNDFYLTENLFSCLQMIIQFIPEAMVKFADPIFEMIHSVIHEQPIFIIKLLIEINNKKYKTKLFSHMYLVLPEYLSLIEQSRKVSESLEHIQPQKSAELIKVTENAVYNLPMFDTAILDDHLYLIVPLLLRTASNGRMTHGVVQMNRVAINTLNRMVECKNFREHTAQVVHQLLRILENQSQESLLVEEIFNSFSGIANNLTSDFAPYISLIQKAIKRLRLMEKSKEFEKTIRLITKLDPIEQFEENMKNAIQVQEEERLRESEDQEQLQTQNQIAAQVQLKELRVRQKINTEDLLKEFDASKCHIADDWTEWLKKTSHQLLKQNPSPILFACSTLTEVYAPLAAELYNIAFVSCWKNMNDGEKQQILNSFTMAKESKSRTTSVLQTILNLAEFMDLDENTEIKLFSARTLAKIAEDCNAYAKALYYWEQEFDSNPRDTIELLIQTNYGLQQPEAAEGILIYAKKNLLIDEQEDWLEKLQKWPEALKLYSKKAISRENKTAIQQRKLNCFRHMMDWNELSTLVKDMWDEHLAENEPDLKLQIRKAISDASPDAAYAAWNLSDWDNFKMYAKRLDSSKHPYEKNFYNAVLEIRNRHFTEAKRHIDKAREVLDSKTTSLLGESYNRAYSLIQELQFLKELEEVIEFKRTVSEEKRQTLYACWQQRQRCMPTNDLEAFQKLLNIRCLVIDKTEEIDNFIQFSKMAQDTSNADFSTRILISLRKELEFKQESLLMQEKKQLLNITGSIQQQQQDLNNKLAKVEIAIYEALYNQGYYDRAQIKLETLLLETNDIEPKLLSTCYQKLAAWQFECLESSKNRSIGEEDYAKIVANCEMATQIDPQNAAAWHYFSSTSDEARVYYSKLFNANFGGTLNQLFVGKEAFQAKSSSMQYLLHREFGHNYLPKLLKMRVYEKTPQQQMAQVYVTHATSAVKGLIQQLWLSSQFNASSNTKTLQTTLRLLKIWFQHGNLLEIQEILRDGFEKIDLKVWIDVIPQLLARIDISDLLIKATLIDLLEKISLKFPQALIYSLSVTQKSTNTERRESAELLIQKLMAISPVLIEQATIISTELNRSAILLSEVWQEAIEEASRIYFGRNDGKAMFNYISTFHNEMREPETMNEIAFYQGYASDLLEAFSWMKRFMITGNTADINQAWDIYYSVFRRISQKQKEVQFYELRNVAPKLISSTNLEIAVPGTFKSNKPVVRISKFASVLPVLASKQHPRKLTVYGDDGREYLFLLKGHEDIRQDERVMQLFGLVNSLLSIDPQTSKKDLSIRRYPVIPLSHSTGLLGWVANSDTLHMLIKEHREENNIIPNIEYKLMESMCEHFETCPLPNKVEIFRVALEKTVGEDLQKVLWVKSQNSEVWLDRRTNYTRSLAVMSMVGYILGLGDRHPSNIMLERYTGKIVHIDFGDCFEIAMRREKFPERIPFRLTRMLIRAMEVSGIEGNFRTTCENTMRVMRDSKESLLAIMEAFVYDPLISFRLLNPKMFPKLKKDRDTEEIKPVEIKSESTDLVAEVERQKVRSISENKLEKLANRGNNLAEGRFSRHVEDLELLAMMQGEDEDVKQKELNQIAEIVIERITDKLRGMEFHNPNKPVEQDSSSAGGIDKQFSQRKPVYEQVDILIKQATCHENLSSCYIGWCPYW